MAGGKAEALSPLGAKTALSPFNPPTDARARNEIPQ